MRGSFCRSEPDAVLRGLAYGGLPASTSCALSSANFSSGKKTSPRTSTRCGKGTSGVTVSWPGTPMTVRTFIVRSSPVRPSPRVAPRTSLPFS